MSDRGRGQVMRRWLPPVLAKQFPSVTALKMSLVWTTETNFVECVVSVTMLRGGEAYNVIPESAALGGTFRSLTDEGLSYLKKRIKQTSAIFEIRGEPDFIDIDLMILAKIIEAQAGVNRCAATVDFMEEELRPYPATVNDDGMYAHAKGVAEAMLGESNVRVAAQTMGAEDFAFYGRRAASAFFFIGVGNETTMGAAVQPMHSPYFVIDERALPVGAALHAAVAMEYLNG
ncbi:hypothetical protein GUJ93_ZPchr0007g3098 [Zizania palustris]|uniref:Peptidase M20 dimerisation domain-containing protein n=1 Tax=Zizania palustris TaxID=103762 RepID=A0A8J5TDW0_ZIZPA|nr:hypothetical protein GUJ93_ZPchr0007g3098 [Zizania palustris]